MSKVPSLFHYMQCGLDNIWLSNGFTVESTDYGPGFAIRDAEALHRAIARALVRSARPLRGQDARFLRVQLKLSQADLGRLLGIDRATVIRWEKARDESLGKMQDVALRSTFLAHMDEPEGFVGDVIRELQEAEDQAFTERPPAYFESGKDGWRTRAAA